MRFKDYLNEEYDFDEAQFIKDCSFYFEQMKGSKLHMYRGIESKRDHYLKYEKIESGSIHQFKPRTKPLSSAPEMHEQINDLLVQMFGYPYRNAMFTTGNLNIARSYGHAYIIVPIGEFSWLSNRQFLDLYVNYQDYNGPNVPRHFPDKFKHAMDLLLKDIKESKTWNHNTNLPDCLASGAEVMVVCDKYYIFDPKTFIPKVLQ